MSKFTYHTDVVVFMDGKNIGTIREVFGGFAFFPKGSKHPGETFSTIAAVKHSLEAE